MRSQKGAAKVNSWRSLLDYCSKAELLLVLEKLKIEPIYDFEEDQKQIAKFYGDTLEDISPFNTKEELSEDVFDNAKKLSNIRGTYEVKAKTKFYNEHKPKKPLKEKPKPTEKDETPKPVEVVPEKKIVDVKHDDAEFDNTFPEVEWSNLGRTEYDSSIGSDIKALMDKLYKKPFGTDIPIKEFSFTQLEELAKALDDWYKECVLHTPMKDKIFVNYCFKSLC